MTEININVFRSYSNINVRQCEIFWSYFNPFSVILIWSSELASLEPNVVCSFMFFCKLVATFNYIEQSQPALLYFAI